MKFQFQPSKLTHRLPVSVEIPNQSIQIDTWAANFTTVSKSPKNIYSHDQNYWRITTKSQILPNSAPNSMVWGISPQPGHFLPLQLADVVGYALPHPRNQTGNDTSEHST